MRIETFMKRALGKVNASDFIREHREFLCNFKSVLPVINLLDKKILFPTGALQQIVTLMAFEKDPVEEEPKTRETVNKKTGEITTSKEKVKKEPKRYQLFLFAKDGKAENCVATYEADSYGEAMKLSNLRLFRREDSVFMDVLGQGVTTRISRDDAIRTLLGPGLGGPTATKKVAKTSSSLGWKASAKGYTAKFSKG